MRRLLFVVSGGAAMVTIAWILVAGCSAASAGFAGAVQEASWTVIEYPMDEEVVVDLLPKSTADAKGKITVKRGTEETAVRVEVSGLGSDPTRYHLYAIDQAGKVTSLGMIEIKEGAGEVSARTSLHKFMLVVSPEAELDAISADTPVALTSSVPYGFTVVPRETATQASEGDAQPASGVRYEAPLLGISSLRTGKEVALKLEFAGEGRGDASLKRVKGGSTQIKMRLYNAGQTYAASQEHGASRFVLWAIAPDESYTRIGEIARDRKRALSKIETKTDLTDFGLFVTAEESDSGSPAGNLVARLVK